MILGQMISKLREDKNYTQKELAKQLNITAGCLSKYETGRSEPPLSIVVQIADLFEVSVDYLLGRNTIKLNYTELKKEYSKAVTGFDMINDMLSLDAQHRKRLAEQLEIIKFHNDSYRLYKNTK